MGMPSLPPDLPPLRIEVRDSALVRQAVIDDFTRFDVSMVFNSVGHWQMELPSNCKSLDTLLQPGAGILLLRDDTGEVWFSGGIEEVTESFDSSGSVYMIRGRDDNGLLADRLALPNPAQEVYSEAVLQDNPAGFWRMNDTLTDAGQQTTDWSGNLRHMICPGAPSFPTSGRAGALQTDGDRSYFWTGVLQYLYRFHDAGLLFNTGQSITLECWAKFTDLAAFRMLIAKGTDTGPVQNYRLGVQTDGAFSFAYSSAGITAHIFSTAAGVITPGVWYHLAATYTYGTPASAHLYVNGKTVTGGWISGTGAQPPDQATDATYLGTRAGGGSFMSGSLDEVAIYRAALSAARVEAHYRAGIREESYVGSVIVDRPSRYYRLGEAAGANAFDSSGNVVTAAYSATGMTIGQPGAIMDSDYAAYFDGLSGMVTAPVLPSLLQWTIEAWIRRDGNQAGANSVISDIHPAQVNFTLSFTPGTGNLYAGFYLASIGWRETPATFIPDREWTHVVGTYNGSRLSLYKNGVLVSFLDVVATLISGGAGIRIGRRWDAPEYFKGHIDEVAIYPTALSPTRIAAHYASRIAGFDVRSGTVEAVMRGYVDANAGPSAIANRRITGLALGTYNTLGATITEQARYATLLDLLRLLAVKGEDGSNLIRNPGFELDTTGYGGFQSRIDRVIHTARFGIASCRVVSTDVVFTGVYFDGRSFGAYPISVLPGVQYTFGLYARLGSAGSKNMTLGIEWKTSADAAISTSSLGVILTSTSWQRFSITATAPGTAARVILHFYTNNAAQGVFDLYTDGWQFLVGRAYQDLTPLGFQLRHDLATSRLVFDVYWPRDRRPEAIYSPTLQNIYGYEHVRPAPEANVIYMGGAGVLTGRMVSVASDTDSIATWGRREVFRDRRDASDQTILAQSAQQELNEHASRETIEIDPMPTEGLVYGADYQLGDRVSVRSRAGLALEQVVHQVDIEISADGGVRVIPHIGPPSILDPDSGRSQLDSIDERINRLEAT